MCIIYAQTEASPGITMTQTGDDARDRAETVGRPLPRTEVRIVNPRDGTATVPIGTVGEICTLMHAMPPRDQPGATVLAKPATTAAKAAGASRWTAWRAPGIT